MLEHKRDVTDGLILCGVLFWQLSSHDCHLAFTLVSCVQLQGTGGQNYSSGGGDQAETKQTKQLDQGNVTGSSDLPVPEVGNDVDTQGFSKLNEKPEEGTLSAAGERSPLP